MGQGTTSNTVVQNNKITRGGDVNSSNFHVGHVSAGTNTVTSTTTSTPGSFSFHITLQDLQDMTMSSNNMDPMFAFGSGQTSSVSTDYSPTVTIGPGNNQPGMSITTPSINQSSSVSSQGSHITETKNIKVTPEMLKSYFGI